METERLLRLADFLETVPPSKFDMGRWLSRGGQPHELQEECGTSACAGGWACVLFQDEGLKWEQDGSWGFMPTYDDMTGSDGLARFFGLADEAGSATDEANDLFGIEPRTPTEEANLIRQLVAESGS